MNITELRYIIEIAQCGSVSAASKRLYVAQPNISKAIRSLEEEYQIQLFVRRAQSLLSQRRKLAAQQAPRPQNEQTSAFHALLSSLLVVRAVFRWYNVARGKDG